LRSKQRYTLIDCCRQYDDDVLLFIVGIVIVVFVFANSVLTNDFGDYVFS
jgi:hypothetical protein